MAFCSRSEVSLGVADRPYRYAKSGIEVVTCSVGFASHQVSPERLYTGDLIYRLFAVILRGREHVIQVL